jgi:hypothetical protein
MAFNQNNSQPKQAETVTKLADAAKAHVGKSAEQAHQAAGGPRAGVTMAANLHEKATLDAQQLLQTSIDAAAVHANEASERVSRALGFSGERSERLVEQSKENLDMVARCGTTLTQAFQDTSRGWLELAQKQWQRNLEGMQRLAGSKSVQEFTTTQSELLRDGLEHMVQDSQAITATSLKAMEQAQGAFKKVPRQAVS